MLAFHRYFFSSLSLSERRTFFPLMTALSSFFSVFLVCGNLTRLRYVIHHYLIFLISQRKNPISEPLYFIAARLLDYLLSFFTRTRFLFYFFYAKTNKKLFKFARYKLPRFYIRYFFIKPHKRFKKLLFILRKAFLISYYPNFGFYENLFRYLAVVLRNPVRWVGRLLLHKVHLFIFKNYRRRLFYFNKSV